MQASDDTGQVNTSQLRNFVYPPAELARIIQAVAEHVAEHGASEEFRLRSGSDGSRQYPFLFLDDIHSPYYQYELTLSRARRDATAYVPADQLPPFVSAGPSDTALRITSDADDVLMRPEDFARLIEFTYGTNTHIPSEPTRPQGVQHEITNHLHHETADQNGNRQQITLPNLDFAFDPPENEDQDTNRATSDNQAPSNHQHRRNSHRSRRRITNQSKNSPPIADGHDPEVAKLYNLHQEVHLLDSRGTERSGLSTYIIIDRSKESRQANTAESDITRAQDNNPSTAGIGLVVRNSEPEQAPIYHLRPDTSATFRTSHHRILPVGFAMGAVVQQVDNAAASIVIKRTVEERRRLYDVRDEFGDIHVDVPEADLQLCPDAFFDFRRPVERK